MESSAAARSHAPQHARGTYDDVASAPETQVAELINGSLYLSARPALPHANACSLLGALLIGAFRFGTSGPGGWHVLFEPELHFGDESAPDVLVPDLAGWRVERLPRLPNAASTGLVPDWVCEVISPSTEALDRVRKLAVYAREGVRHAWLLNPLTRTLEVYRLENGRWSLVLGANGPARVRAEPFDALELDLALLWPADEAPAK